MYESDILSNLYAYQAYFYLFNDCQQVNQGVLPDFSPEQQDAIYGDYKYGMDTVYKLMIWVIASDGTKDEKADAKSTLLAHFSEQGMTEDKLNAIVGTGSMLSMIIAPIRYNIVHDPAFGWCTSKTCLLYTSPSPRDLSTSRMPSSA